MMAMPSESLSLLVLGLPLVMAFALACLALWRVRREIDVLQGAERKAKHVVNELNEFASRINHAHKP